jgi:hypothetical protein
VIEQVGQYRHLVFRITNHHREQFIQQAAIKVAARVQLELDGVETVTTWPMLKLERSFNPLLSVDAEVRHVIDEDSPIFHLVDEEGGLTIKASISGVDSVFKKDFFAIHVYSDAASSKDNGAIKRNASFQNFIYTHGAVGNESMIRSEKIIVDLGRFHDVVEEKEGCGAGSSTKASDAAHAYTHSTNPMLEQGV